MNSTKIIEDLQNYYNSNNYIGACSFLEEIYKEKDNNLNKTFICYHIGRIYYYEKKYNEAEKWFTRALKYNPKEFYSKFYLGKIKQMQNNSVDALKLFMSCLKQRPKYTQLSEYLGNNIRLLKDGSSEIEELLVNEEKIKNEELFRKDECPKISIIILCYNKIEYTEKCINAIFENTEYSNYEIIVLNNASVDDTAAFLETFDRKITTINSRVNLGFVNGNNLAANNTNGEYIVFLNNDTEVKKGWLNELYNTFVVYQDTGVAGAKLIYPNNTLQEAGGIIFQDASGWNYGRLSNPNDSNYNFVREVDYCSGAALMIRKDIFIKVGGFDSRYSPAYCEDSDLCFSVRKLGYKVRYNPFAIVIHHEGVTAGRDTNSGFKKYQEINTPKFYEKWNKVLIDQYANDPEIVLKASNRNKNKTIIIIDDWPPLPDRASGTRRMYYTVKQMLKLGYQIVYVHLTGKNLGESAFSYFHELESLGVEMIWFGFEGWWEFRNSPGINNVLDRLVNSLELKKREPCIVYLSFWWVAKYFIDRIRKILPQTTVIVDTHDIHYIREERQATITGNPKLKKQAKENKKEELEVYSKADCVTTVTENDRGYLKNDLHNKAIFIMTNIHEVEPTIKSFEKRRDFLFVGNFNHLPNEDAAIYFAKEIYPDIKRELSDAKFYIVGNNPTSKIKALADESIIVTGWVPEVNSYIENCRVSVVPLRYGAGVKGKVGENFAHGLPTVMTSIGAEGMNVINGEHAFIADDPSQFSKYSIELYTNKEKWEKFSQTSKELIKDEYSSEATRKRLSYILSYKNRDSFKSNRALNYSTPPKVSIIIITYNQYPYTEKCIKSIINNTKVNYEIIIVDNASTDDTVKEINKFPDIRLIENKENLGFPAAVNQGINVALGDFILLLNNDTLVTEGWLERMLQVIESDEFIGIVGPISNHVSGVQLDKNANYKDLEQMNHYASEVKNINSGQVQTFPRMAFLCTLIKKEVIEKIGGLDERFSPGNYEDDDFCLRAQLAGYKAAIAKDVFIHHFGSVSFGARGKERYLDRLKINEEIFINKWGQTPDEIWIKGNSIKKRNKKYPLNKDLFIQHFERSLIHLEENEISLALSELKKSKQVYYSSPRKGYEKVEFPDVLNLTGNTYLMNGEVEKARENFEEELQITPNSSRACMGLGDVFAASKIYESAKIMYEWAVKNDPDDKSSHSKLEKMNIKLGFPKDNNSLIKEI